MEGRSLGLLKEEKKISLIGEFYEEFARHVKEGSVNRQFSPTGPLLGNQDGVHLLGLLSDRRRRALEMGHLILCCMVLTRKPQYTFCVCVSEKLWRLSDKYIWFPFFWTLRIT